MRFQSPVTLSMLVAALAAAACGSTDLLKHYCAPCTTNSECGGGTNLCVSFSNGTFTGRSSGSFCSVDCTSSGVCPSNSQCVAVTGTDLKTCVPATGFQCSSLATGGGGGRTGGGSGSGAPTGGGVGQTGGGVGQTGGGVGQTGGGVGDGQTGGGGDAQTGGGDGQTGGGAGQTGGGTGVDPTQATSVTVNGATHGIDGANMPRGEDQLIVYTALAGQTQTPTNKWGTEVAVLNGVVLSVTDRHESDAPPIVIPPGGYVLSGHYNAGMWLSANATVGAAVTLALGGAGTGGGGGTSSCTTETWGSIGSPVMNGSCTGCHSEFGDAGSVASNSSRIASKIRGGHFSGGISSSDKSRVLQWLDCGAP